jgi:hypothetical protein
MAKAACGLKCEAYPVLQRLLWTLRRYYEPVGISEPSYSLTPSVFFPWACLCPDSYGEGRSSRTVYIETGLSKYSS